MYDPEKNEGIDWHDLTATEKVKYLIDENTWLAGVLSAEMGKQTTQEQNIQMARKFVYVNYRELWQLVHGNFPTWPAENSLQKMVNLA